MSETGRRITLVIPGLLDLPEGHLEVLLPATTRLPDLETTLSRAERRDRGGYGLDASLFALFGVDTEPHQDLPVAAVSYFSDTGNRPAGWCVRADPVHLMPDRDRLMLLGPESLSLSTHEARSLSVELDRFFAEDGWHIEAPHPERWYLQLEEVPALRTHPLAVVRGRAIGEFLPVGADGKLWHRALNEVQMLLHTQAVNLERQSRNQPAVSSVWFWGGGLLPEVPRQRWSHVYSDNAVGIGLARLSDSIQASVPADASQWLAQGAGEATLVVLESLAAQWLAQSQSGWVSALQDLQAQWISPLLTALRQQQIDELECVGCDGRGFSLTRRGLGRWWRRPRPLKRFSGG